jgi:nickel-dependent lactate racemase
MEQVSLGYGSSEMSFEFDASRFRVVVPEVSTDSAADPASEHLIDSDPLDERCRGKRVLVIVSDLTRPTGSREFLPGLLRQLKAASSIRLLFATGIHRPLEDVDKIQIVGPDVFDQYPMLDHEPETNTTYVGDTSFGNRVEIDSQVLEDELIVLTGAIGFHYFAGFSGGRKSLLPGVASKSSIEFNHLLVLDPVRSGRNPAVRVACMNGNPVHEDMVEGARLTGRELFVYNTILDEKKRVRKVFAGDWIEAHRRGTIDYMRDHSVQIDSKRPLAIVSCGGFPRDINMIQAHKALEFAQHAVDPGGTIILLAQCREGTGHPSFFHWFEHTNLDRFEQQLRAGYEVYGQTAYSLLSKARRFRVICVSDLEPGHIRTMGMEPAPDLDSALSLVDPRIASAPGFILPLGAEVLPSLS